MAKSTVLGCVTLVPDKNKLIGNVFQTFLSDKTLSFNGSL